LVIAYGSEVPVKIVPWIRRWRWRLLAMLLTVVVLALLYVASTFVTLQPRDFDKNDASRDLVAWVVEGRSVPGFSDPYPDAKWMPRMKHFYVNCDFLPPDVSLSGDPRVQRITAKEYKQVFAEHKFDDTDYIEIRLKSESATELVFEFTNVFGSLAGHGYLFTFRRTPVGLRAKGEFL
jgi:hypothetical protein